MYRLFLAYKYAFRLITLAALLAVTYSVTVLIVVVSVMEGFRSELESHIRGITSDIKVASTEYIGLQDPVRVEEILRGIPGVRSTAAYVETLALFQLMRPGFGHEAEKAIVLGEAEDRILLGMDIDNETAARELDSYLEKVALPNLPFGNKETKDRFAEMFDRLPKNSVRLFSREWLEENLWRGMKPPWLDDPENPYLPAIIGVEALRQDLLVPGSPFPNSSFRSLFRLTSFSPIPPHAPRGTNFYVAGYFKTGLYELDSKGIILRLEDADNFLQLRGPEGTLRVSGIRVNVESEYADEEPLTKLRQDIEKKLEENEVYFVKTQTWREARSALLQAVKMEKIIVSIILGVVILFAGFMIFIILTVQVVERSRDIGVLQSIGSTARGIATIYFFIGFSLCLLGTLLGTIYGVGFAMCINPIQHWIKLLTGYEVFPGDVYYIDKIPVRFSPEDLFFIIVPTVAASLLASIVPALRAARKDPVVTLRYE